MNMIDLINSVLAKCEPFLKNQYKELGGLNTEYKYTASNVGLRRLGSERILQGELYHQMRNILPPEYFVALEFRPFTNYNKINAKDIIDLALFDEKKDLLLTPPVAKIWIELKISGGNENTLKNYQSDLEKLNKLYNLYKEHKLKTPEYIVMLAFLESPNDTFDKDKLAFDSIQNKDILSKEFLDICYEGILWREEKPWELKKIEPTAGL